MTEEIQAAYNEWLLKYGFRWVDVDVLRVDRPVFFSVLPHNTMDKYVKNNTPNYQLKTPEELQNENPTNTT